MDRPPSDDRSALSLAWAWATRIMAIAVMMVVPALIGVWIDWKLGTTVVFLLLGLALGITGAVMQLIRVAKESESESSSPSEKE